MNLSDREAEILSRLAYANIAEQNEFRREFIENGYSLKDLATYLIKEKEAGRPRDFGSYGSLANKDSMRC